MNFSYIIKLSEPFSFLWIGGVDSLLDEVRKKPQTCIQLDGAQMKTLDAFYDELSLKVRLPDYFGRNLNALLECLSEMEEWPDSPGFLLILENAHCLLSDESDDAFAGAIEVFRSVGKEWSEPIELGEEWDRPAKPFNTVFQSNGLAAAPLGQRLKKLGLSLPELLEPEA